MMQDTELPFPPVEAEDENDQLQTALSAMFQGQMPHDEETTRTVTITMPTIDELGLQEEAPTVTIHAKGTGTSLVIDTLITGQARSRAEYDAIVHLIGLSI